MIEPTLYYETLNRAAVLIKARKPFYDWVRYVDPDFPVVEDDEGTIYLIPDQATTPKIESWLKNNYSKIFINELSDYHTDVNDWPQKRTYREFKNWFSVEISSMVVDLLEEPIVKE